MLSSAAVAGNANHASAANIKSALTQPIRGLSFVMSTLSRKLRSEPHAALSPDMLLELSSVLAGSGVVSVDAGQLFGHVLSVVGNVG